MDNAPRLMIAAPASGSGKTTFTCALLRALLRRGLRCASFKCGPDYIDPMFHRESVGVCKSANLDLFLCGEDAVLRLLGQGSRGADVSVLEGVMGFYDGLAGKSERASSWDVARVTGTPVALLINGRGMSVSAAALVKGFLGFRDSGIQAVVFNNVSPMTYALLKETLERECGLPVAGYLPPMENCALESRHLGLVTAGETANLTDKLDKLAEKALETVDLELLLRIAREAPPLKNISVSMPPENKVRLAVARDAAFCFYYQETLDLLEELGAELIPFSPLADKLPPEADALLLGGGYPELYADALAENIPMRRGIAQAVRGGMPTLAECGGFLYLGDTLEGMDGKAYPMAGALPGNGFRTPKLRRFGYAALTARRDNLLCPAGGVLRAHEFHYWDTTAPGDGFTAEKPLSGRSWDCVQATERLYAGFPHLYLAGAPETAARFLRAAAAYGKEQQWN